MKITGTIITLNEEKYISRAVESLANICEEIIVLDSKSTDSTRNLAELSGAKVFTQSFLGDGKQKKEASKFSKNDWIFSLDADEYLDIELIETENISQPFTPAKRSRVFEPFYESLVVNYQTIKVRGLLLLPKKLR